jgi:N-formylglutamate amidohydrolase
VEIVRKHGRPAEHRHSLQLEIKRTLYMDERTFEPNGGFLRLEADLARLTATIASHLRSRLPISASPEAPPSTTADP